MHKKPGQTARGGVAGIWGEGGGWWCGLEKGVGWLRVV